VEPQIEKEIIALLPRLRRFARSLTGTAAAADDLAQAAVERAITHLDKWQPGTRLDSWIYRIAHNLWRNEMRNEATRGAKHVEILGTAPHAMDGERAAVARLQFAAVSEAIAALPEDQRTALLLVAVEGLSYKEAAEITGATVAALTSRIARARDTLRLVIERSD
jgi:RNA polymerase sigma-70 factor (ECF subfamily)